MTPPKLTTAVIGAGPAGQLFAIAASILAEKKLSERSSFVVRVYDKRDSYARTHRLRIDPEPYEALARELDDPRFLPILTLLRENDFSPEVNLLEDALARTIAELGVEKERLTIGDGDGETSLAALRERLTAEGLLGPDTIFTIVAADSVHSAVREMVRGDARPELGTHERVARLRVEGEELPARLGVIEKVRLSKVLGSIVDYRRNRNGFAEVDLFMTAKEHAAVRALDATPKAPVAITSAMLAEKRLPFFRSVVAHLERRIAEESRVFVYSTFTLEHTMMPRLSFDAKSADARVFLVGDAGVSLPFFRGMACLAKCVASLSRVHVALAEGAIDLADASARYEREAAAIKSAELRIVRARGRVIRALREAARVSALLPFPIQSWILRAPDLDADQDRATPWLFVNAATAIAAAVLALGGSALPLVGRGELAWLALLSFPIEVVGGVLFHAAVSFQSGPHKYVRRVWQAQITLLFVAGTALSALSLGSNHPIVLAPATYWLTLAAAFVLGLYGFETIVSRALASADLPIGVPGADDEKKPC